MLSLFHIYIFALVFGGVLLVASIVLGGGRMGDADADASLDVDGDADFDASADADADTDTGGHGSLAGALASLLSLRFWMFFCAFFGATGWLFEAFDLGVERWPAFAIAVAMGVLTGSIAVAVLRALSASGSGEIVTSAAYVGQTGRVLLPIGPDAIGKVRLQLGGTTVDVLARSDNPHGFTPGDQALVIAMNDTTATVAKLDGTHN